MKRSPSLVILAIPGTLAALLSPLPAAAGTVSYHGDGYTLQYETGTDFSGFHAAASGANRSFGWGPPT